MGLTLGGVAAGAGPDVGGGDVGAQRDPPAPDGGPTLPVGLLGVQEEPAVERSDVGEGAIGQEQDRADQEVRSPPEWTQAERLQPCPGRRRERPAHPGLLPEPGVALGRGDGGQLRIGSEWHVEAAYGVGRQLGVGVEQQDVTALPPGAADVDADRRSRGCDPDRR